MHPFCLIYIISLDLRNTVLAWWVFLSRSTSGDENGRCKPYRWNFVAVSKIKTDTLLIPSIQFGEQKGILFQCNVQSVHDLISYHSYMAYLVYILHQLSQIIFLCSTWYIWTISWIVLAACVTFNFQSVSAAYRGPVPWQVIVISQFPAGNQKKIRFAYTWYNCNPWELKSH